MRGHFAPGFALAMIVSAILPARSDDAPILDVRPVCRGIASQAAEPLAKGLPSSFDECVKSEQEVREQLRKQWSAFSAADKQHCVTLAKTGGESSYTELITCLEMSRDVRALNSAAATKRNASSASMPTSRPAPADKTSQVTATKEPSASETGEPKKDLERAKTDAFNAKASETVAQRKLADAETALQQVKEEAKRATAESERSKAALQEAKEETRRATEEAQRSKADAKAARDTEVELERKLADADTARVAAEGREQACLTAAKTPSGFGTRFRSWFRPKQPDAPQP
jgi:chromosome segregation ATPase